MPLEISRNDIRYLKVDAIVNPTDCFYSGSGNTDKKIHEAAGDRLKEKLSTIENLEPGQCVITDAYDMDNCRYIIHTCGPIYQDGKHDEDEILSLCYRNALSLAKDNDLESIGFPLISSGTFGFPKGRALKIASDTITDFLMDNEMNVYLLVYDKQAFDHANKLYSNIKDYLNKELNKKQSKKTLSNLFGNIASLKDAMYDDEESIYEATADYYKKSEVDSAMIFEPDESFSECMIRMIDERGMLDPEVYKRANIDRKHFNHIKNDKYYRPKKETAVALAIGMKLDIKETNTLLERAGFILSSSSVFDLIIKYCIEHKIYDIYQINEILFEEDQKTLG